jgi:nitrogen fixation/metabolism regulation signal transduction histidine kinase
MIDQLMRPMHNLSLATKEIAKGNYGVMVHNQEKNKDVSKMVDEKSNKKRFCVSEVLTSKVILLAKL